MPRQCRDAGQLAAFQPFEEGAAGARDVGELFRHARGVERCDGVSAPGHGHQRSGLRALGGGAGERERPLAERRDLEGAERAVPEQRLATREHIDIVTDGLGADVEDHLPRPDVHRQHGARRRACLETLGDHDVLRQHDLAAPRFRGVHDLAGRFDKVGLGQRLSDLDSAREQERVGHTAANDQLVDLGG